MALLVALTCGCARAVGPPPTFTTGLPVAPVEPVPSPRVEGEQVRVEGELLRVVDKVVVVITLRNETAQPLMVSLASPGGVSTWVTTYFVVGSTTGAGGGWPGGVPVGCRTTSPPYTLVIPPGGSVGRGQELGTGELGSDAQTIEVHARIMQYRSWQCAPVDFIEKTLRLSLRR
jgi:hypothetical protein